MKMDRMDRMDRIDRIETGRNQNQNTAAGQEHSMFTECEIDMATPGGVTAKPIHNRISLSIVKYKLIYIDKKSSITRVYLRSP